MNITISFLILIITAGIGFTCITIQFIKNLIDIFDKEKKLNLDMPSKPFSLADYLEREEKIMLEIQEEIEKREKYEMILWLGLDGLNVETGEWVSRRKNKHKQTSVLSTEHQTEFKNGMGESWNKISIDQNDLFFLRLKRYENILDKQLNDWIALDFNDKSIAESILQCCSNIEHTYKIPIPGYIQGINTCCTTSYNYYQNGGLL